jgi:hypothetical protein
MTVRFLFELLSGRGKYEIDSSGIFAMYSSIGMHLTMILFRVIVNSATSDDLYGVKLLTTPMISWVILILALINIYVIKVLYNGKSIYRIPSDHTLRENERITSEKVCARCKTVYTLGSKCPKCGFTISDELK